MPVDSISTSTFYNYRKAKASTENDVFLSNEKINRLREKRDSLKRYSNEKDSSYQKEFEAIEASIAVEDNTIYNCNEKLKGINDSIVAIWGKLVDTTDPKDHVYKLDEKYPILLMPLRIETRFKKTVEKSGDTSHQLMIRAYPDDCSIDTFEENLSEAEVLNAQTFWMDFWAAAGNDSNRRAAWRYLADGHGYGRAQYIIDNYQPTNIDEIRQSWNELSELDVFLVLNGETEIREDEKVQLSEFWSKYYLSQVSNNLEGRNAAINSLKESLGEERSRLLINEYPPKNLKQEPPPVGEGQELTISVKYIEFPADPDMQQEAWSHAARVKIMPEHLRFLAFKEDEVAFDKLGDPIPFPLIMGPDPKMTKEDKYTVPGTDIEIPKDMSWMADFEEAKAKGMAMSIELTKEQAENGFDRLFVLGVKMSSTRSDGMMEMEELFKNHYSGNSGFGFLPVGTPTNNTEDTTSAYSETQDSDDSYEMIYKFIKGEENENKEENGAGENEENPFWWNKSDRDWFCELLSIPGETFNNTINTDGRDQLEARAMNIALWPATWGYFFETMLEGVLSDEDIKCIRWYFNNFVVGRGTLPSIRIDDQPYGILPTTAFSRINWLNDKVFIRAKDLDKEMPADFGQFMSLLNSKFSIIQDDWKRMSEKVSHVGSSGDPHAILLDILGLHGGSVEFYNRLGESYEHIYNLFQLSQKNNSLKDVLAKVLNLPGYDPSQEVTEEDLQNALGNSYGGKWLLQELGYKGKFTPEILEKLFVLEAEKLTGPLIDDQALSEYNMIRQYINGTNDEEPNNYISWLINVAETSFEALRREEGFKKNHPPNALLYLMLKYALEQSYFQTSLDLFKFKDLIPDDMIRVAKTEPNFVHIRTPEPSIYVTPSLRTTNLKSVKVLDSPFRSESRYNFLYQEQKEITGSTGKLVGEYIPDALKERHVATQYLFEQIQALRLLEKTPTARLERLLTEHIDCASYRFDAWKFGLVNYQLKALRNRTETAEEGGENETDPNKGLYIGAYGWLEDVRSENKELIPKKLSGELKEQFNPSELYPIHEDKSNLGFINAPSMNHAVTAAILRNGYEAYASEENAEMFNINLSSERVRKALKMIEGMQNGQSLAALLGYEFERDMHDSNDLDDVDQYIFKIRAKFPLGSKQINSTLDGTEGEAIEKVEARNVVHGLDLIDYVEANLGPDGKFRDYSGIGVESPSDAVKSIIDAAIDKIRDINDACADLAFAESVHQMAQGNIERAAGTLDTYSEGNYPQIPDVIETPRSGVNLTHRVGIHIKPNTPVTPGQSPRAMAEPGLNLFMKDTLPGMETIMAYVSFNHKASGSDIEHHQVSMADLNLQPIDLLYMIDLNSEQAMTALDDCIVDHILNHSFPVEGEDSEKPRPDADIHISYLGPPEHDGISIFEIAPLIRNLKSLLLNSRPLKAGDVIASDEASSGSETHESLNIERINAVRQYLYDIEPGAPPPAGTLPLEVLDKLVADLTDSLGEGGDSDDTIISEIDTNIDAYLSLLQHLAPIGLPQTGTGFLFQWRKTQLSRMFEKVENLIKVWDEKTEEYNSLLAPFDPDADDAMALLLKAERIISTKTTLDPGNNPLTFKNNVLDAVKLPAFEDKRENFQDFMDANYMEVTTALSALEPLMSYEEFYLVETDINDIKTSCRLFADEILNKADLLQKDIIKRKDKIDTLLGLKFDNETDQLKKIQLIQEAAKLLLGEEFVMIPTFSIPTNHSHEWNTSLGMVDNLLDYQVNSEGNPLPVDNWFYGVARVREKLAQMEQAMMLIEGFTDKDIELIPVQFPRLDPYRWFAMKFKDDDEASDSDLQKAFRENDHMLYTAYYYETFEVDKDICGLLIDEWTEIIPTEEETTGLAFHYDRPNSEPPQTLLLAVSPNINGEGWQWDDLVAILHETLDEAKLRAVEPQQIEHDMTKFLSQTGLQYTGYANLLPATISSVTKYPVSIMLNYAFNNLPITANTLADD